MKLIAHNARLASLILLALLVVPRPAWSQGNKLLVPNNMTDLRYPDRSLAAGLPGTVLAQVRINAKGYVTKVLDVQGVKGSPDFEMAVRKTIDQWTFRREVRDQCEPVEAEGVAQIEFSVKDGKPVIGAAGRPDVEARLAEFQPRPRNVSFQSLVESTYPPRAKKDRLGAAVVVVTDYEVTTGIPLAARATQVSFSATPGYQGANQEFAAAAVSAMLRSRFEADGNKPGDINQACVVLHYAP